MCGTDAWLIQAPVMAWWCTLGRRANPKYGVVYFIGWSAPQAPIEDLKDLAWCILGRRVATKYGRVHLSG